MADPVVESVKIRVDADGTTTMSLVSKSFKWQVNPDGTLDGSYPAGTKPPDVTLLSWNIGTGLTNAGIAAMQTGTPFSHNVRQYLSGTEAATATISIVQVSGDDPLTNGWTAPGGGNTLAYNSVSVKSGSFKLSASAPSGVAESQVNAWLCAAAPVVGADFTIGTGIGAWDGVAKGVVAGQVIELVAGTHVDLTISNVVGTAANPITIRGPSLGTATIRRTSASSGGFVFRLNNCRHVILDGSTTDTGVALTPDGIGTNGAATTSRKNIKVMYASNAAIGNKDSPSFWIKFGDSGGGGTWTGTRDITVRYIEVDGGWTSGLSANGGALGTNIGTAESAYPTAWQENIIVEHCCFRNCYQEGIYCGHNTYGTQRAAPYTPYIPLRHIKLRYNYFSDLGADGVVCKSWFDGTPGGDGATENSVHHNVFIRCGTNPLNSGLIGAPSIGTASAKANFYNNWIENSGDEGIKYSVHLKTSLSTRHDGIFTAKIYDNVIIGSGSINPGISAGIKGRKEPTEPASIAPTLYVFNNTVLNSQGIGIEYNSGTAGINANSFVRHNVVRGSGGAEIDAGPGSALNNVTTGVQTDIFVDPVGNYDSANIDVHLKSPGQVIVGGTLGTDVAATDYEGDARVIGTADKGAYEYP
jgi:hypothetical protein